MEKRHLGLLLRIGAMVALPVLAVGYSPNPISAGSQEKTYCSWSDYGGSPDSMGYSAAKQINKTNVTQLKLAWFVPAPGPAGRFSFNPLVIDGVMYVVGKDDGIYALDAATGKQIWAHAVEGGQPTNRGFNHWISKDGKRSAADFCRRWISSRTRYEDRRIDHVLRQARQSRSSRRVGP